MAGRIVLLGATGFTGELTARALVRDGARPLLAARSRERVEALGAELGGLQTAVVDVTRPRTLAELVQRGDVLVSTVGPFARWGETAVSAAIAASAHYIDSTGEPPFIRRVFERFGPQAHCAGSGLLTAMGYDYVPGNLAGALALREAGGRAVRVDVGYFTSAGTAGQLSGGTRASAAGILLEPGYGFRGGRLRSERAARHLRDFELDERRRRAISVGATEQFTLPRIHPELRDIDVWLGWFGPASRPLALLSAASQLVTKLPGARRAIGAATARLIKGSTGGPDGAARAPTRSIVVANASDAAGTPLARAVLEGSNPYDFTAAMLAWSAIRVANGGLRGSGALGPVDGFGLDALEAGVARAGIARRPPGSRGP